MNNHDHVDTIQIWLYTLLPKFIATFTIMIIGALICEPLKPHKLAFNCVNITNQVTLNLAFFTILYRWLFFKLILPHNTPSNLRQSNKAYNYTFIKAAITTYFLTGILVLFIFSWRWSILPAISLINSQLIQEIAIYTIGILFVVGTDYAILRFTVNNFLIPLIDQPAIASD